MSGSLLCTSVLLTMMLCTSCSLVVDYLESDEPSDVAMPIDAGPLVDAPIGLDASAVGCTDLGPDGICVIDCDTPECTGPIVCPQGRACEVNCTGDTACELTAIDETIATSGVSTCDGIDNCDVD